MGPLLSLSQGCDQDIGQDLVLTRASAGGGSPSKHPEVVARINFFVVWDL